MLKTQLYSYMCYASSIHMLQLITMVGMHLSAINGPLMYLLEVCTYVNLYQPYKG